MSRVACRAGLLVLLGFSAAHAAGAAPAPAPAVRFPALRLAGGGIAAAHQSASGEASDAAAARRRAEILRSPYARLTDRRALRGGEVVLASDQDLAPATRDALLRDLPPALAALGSDVTLRLRRAPECPAALSASGAEWRSGAVEVA